MLALSCIISGFILADSEEFKTQKLSSVAELDSLLMQSVYDSGILPEHRSVRMIRIDSAFTRKLIRLKVPGSFSKTLYHIDLQNRLSPFGFDTPAAVEFPDRDMNIHIYYNNTIFRTIRLQTDNSLDSLYNRDESAG